MILSPHKPGSVSKSQEYGEKISKEMLIKEQDVIVPK